MGKILVIDDEQRNLLVMEALLTPLGHNVHLASSGEQGLQAARTDPPDLILLDIQMPGMDGFQVARRVKEDENTRLIPVVMVTGLTDEAARERALEAGADDFLAKPVDRTELKTRVRSLLKVKAFNDHMIHHQKELETQVASRTEQLRQALERTNRASLETIHRLSRAAEYKDENTGEHIVRMSHYSAAIAHTLGLAEKTVQSILYAAPLHDIGKIGIPDRILLKPGKLDPEEWAIMKQHTLIGAGILKQSDSEVIRLAETIALSHHERWDGSGYPQGLAGEDIPLAGRIVAIADVFDALTSRRPYKEAFSLEKTFGIIREGLGRHFAPAVGDAFFSIRDRIVSIRETYQDRQESPFVLLADKAGKGA